MNCLLYYFIRYSVMFPSNFLSFKSISAQEQFQHKHDNAGGRRNKKKTFSHPGGKDGNCKCSPCGDGVSGRSKDGRKGHDSQCHIRNIIKKRTKCYVFDFFPNQGQRKDADQRGDAYHDCNIKKDIILHLQNPP